MNAIKGEANTCQPAPALGRRRSTRRCSPTASVGPTFDAMQAAVRASLPDLRGVDAGEGRLHADDQRCRPPRRCRLAWWDLVAPLPVAAVRDLVGRGHRRRPVGVRRVQPDARRARRPGARRAVDRCAPRRRQVGRGILHAVRRRPLARAAELVGLGRVGADHRPRTRPRLPQHDVGRSHGAAAAAPDGARRDRQHLLRDARRRGRAWPASRATIASPCSTSTSRARTRSSSTSTRGSCSRPRSSPDVSGARSAPASCAR